MEAGSTDAAPGRLRRVLSSPIAYWSWAFFTVATLCIAYPFDPYVYAFAALGLAWLTGVVTFVAVGAVALWAWDWPWSQRLLVVSGVTASVIAVGRALSILTTFRWT